MKNPNCSVMRYFHSSEHKCESRGWLGCTQELRTASRLLFAAFTILLLGGCVAVGPDYVPPETAVPGAWASQLCSGLRAGEMDPAEVARWWTKLGDPVLSNLVDRAVAGNLDLKEARARVREARARRGITRADRFPTMNTSASGSSKHTSEKAVAESPENSTAPASTQAGKSTCSGANNALSRLLKLASRQAKRSCGMCWSA